MSLFTKYRPDEFSEMVGNDHLVSAVQALVEKEEIPHSWLFTGSSGIGKTTIARIIAREVGATTSGIFEINASSIRGIDAIRDILQKTPYRSLGSSKTVYILDECHQLTKEAQNALLKVLEDPPAHVYFILATTDPQKLIGTIRTRCEEFKFTPVGADALIDLVTTVAHKESLNLSPKVIAEIVANASGSPRLALNMLERCSVVGDSVEDAKKLVAGMGIDFQVDGEFTISGEIFDVLQEKKNARGAWKQISSILDTEVLKAHVDVNTVKQGLTSRMGRSLIKVSHAGTADAVLLLESIQNMYSSASFVAIMFKVVQAYYNGGVNNGNEGGFGASSGDPR